jgi:hypothetical protein
MSFKYVSSQQIIYSQTLKQDNRNMYFEILGKFGDRYLIYKKLSRSHFITSYSQDMQMQSVVELDFIPEKTFNLDFVTYNNKLLAIYQYQKNNIVYCWGADINPDGKLNTNPRLLDTTSIGYFSDNKIYNAISSENKKNILIYKRNYRNERMTIATKLLTDQLVCIDSTHQSFEYNNNKMNLSDFIIDNEGTVYYADMEQKYSDDYHHALHLNEHKVGAQGFSRYEVQLNGKYIADPLLKADNQNSKCLINALFYENKRGNVTGMMTTAKSNGDSIVQWPTLIYFTSDLAGMISSNDRNKNGFDNLTPKNIILKKNGGFLLVLEDQYEERFFNNNWNRNFWGSPFGGLSDYYWYNPYYYNYRPWTNQGADASIRYYNNDVVVLSVDSLYSFNWNTLIPKKQYDVDNQNYLSFGIVNTGKEMHLLYLEKDSRRNIISDHSIAPDGTPSRKPTLKSFENDYEFMPRLLKQVGQKKSIVPFTYLNRIGFALITLE